MPLYGRSWTLEGEDKGHESKALGPGNTGPFTRSAGSLGYNEICMMFKQGGWTVKRDDTFKVPYMVKGNQWISYDDVQSINDKVEFLKSKGLAGAMVWSIDLDDFRGDCDKGTYPLLKKISNGLNSESDKTINTTKSTDSITK